MMAPLLQYIFKDKPSKTADEKRKQILLQMLTHQKYKWRSFDRLKHVVGADDETTKRLLLEIGARASACGKPIWGLITRNPFDGLV
jgi:hypothetical protein